MVDWWIKCMSWSYYSGVIKYKLGFKLLTLEDTSIYWSLTLEDVWLANFFYMWGGSMFGISTVNCVVGLSIMRTQMITTFSKKNTFIGFTLKNLWISCIYKNFRILRRCKVPLYLMLQHHIKDFVHGSKRIHEKNLRFQNRKFCIQTS